MKKLLAVALLSVAALGLSNARAWAGHFFHHHCCDRVGACAAQYNAFSPFCVSGVYTSHHCHKCVHPAEAPCCCPIGGADICGDGVCGPAAVAGGDGATLGILPAPAAPGTAQNTQPTPPLAPVPTPVPAIPGQSSQLSMPARMIQPLGYQPLMPAPSAPAYWYGNN
jgi:hypothetical protein